MKCLSLDKIYLYLETELPAEEMNRINNHIATCRNCRLAVENRKAISEAADSLPLFRVPPDFTQQVMARIFREKASTRLWIAGLATGFSLIVAIFLAAFLQSNLNLSGAFIQLNRILWNFVGSLSVFFVKSIKVVSLAFDLLLKLSGFIYTTLKSMTSAVGTELQIILVGLTIFISLTLFFGVRRLIWTGEKI